MSLLSFGCVFPCTAAADPPYWDGHDYGPDACGSPTSSLDMCTYYDVPDLWECELDNALTPAEVSAGYEIVSSEVHMVKDQYSGSLCTDDASSTWDYCAFGEVVVDDGSGPEPRYFLCGIENAPLKDARLLGTAGTDTLRFHFDVSTTSTAYELQPDDYSNDLAALLRGHADDDELHGSRYADSGGRYLETLRGDDGIDTIWGHPDDDVLVGGAGGDFLYGGAGKDNIDGGEGNDVIHAGVGDDTQVLGGPGNDYICGGEGDDILDGDGGDDQICGDEGDNDILRGGGDDDQLWDPEEDGAYDQAIGGLGTNDQCNAYDMTCEDETLSTAPSGCIEDPEDTSW